MTYLFGTYYDENNLFLMSDTLEVEYDEEEKLGKRTLVQKILYSDKWAIGHTGRSETDDKTSHLKRFLGILKGWKRYEVSLEDRDRMIKESLDRYQEWTRSDRKKEGRPHFEEVIHLNRKCLRDGYEDEDLHEFMLATVKPLGLFKVDIFGNLKEHDDYLLMGHEEGIEYIKKYFLEEFINENAKRKQELNSDEFIERLYRMGQKLGTEFSDLNEKPDILLINSKGILPVEYSKRIAPLEAEGRRKGIEGIIKDIQEGLV